MRLLLILLIFTDSQANERLARVIDKDGFTNVRAGQGLSFDIVDKVTTDDFFYCESENKNEWIKVKLLKWNSGDQVTGYIHKSKIQIIEELSNEKQKQIILKVLGRQKLLADRFVESHKKYNKDLNKWNNEADSVSYKKSVGELEYYSETAYSPILELLPNLFCSTKDNTLISNFIKTIWSDKGSASEQPSFAIGECFVCDTKVMTDQIRQLKNKEQKELIINHIEWGLLNKFSVDENKESTDPTFLKVKGQLDLVRD
jgi:hypothetical protein